MTLSCNSSRTGSIVSLGRASFEYTPTTQSNYVTLSTCGSHFDTVLYVYELPTNRLTFSCDDCGACGRREVKTFRIDASNSSSSVLRRGTRYRIQVGGYSSNFGTFSLHLTCHNSSTLNVTTMQPTNHPTRRPTGFATTTMLPNAGTNLCFAFLLLVGDEPKSVGVLLWLLKKK